jgi:hypothetical protein
VAVAEGFQVVGQVGKNNFLKLSSNVINITIGKSKSSGTGRRSNSKKSSAPAPAPPANSQNRKTSEKWLTQIESSVIIYFIRRSFKQKHKTRNCKRRRQHA